MAETKLRIDLSQGIVEVEGDTQFVRSVYADLKEHLLSFELSKRKPMAGGSSGSKQARAKSPKSGEEKPGRKKRPGGGRASGFLVKDLDLSGAGKAERLKDFYESYKAQSNFERNLIFVYYLQHKLNLPEISIAHVFTCYREVGAKVPAALQQSLWDTTNRRGWIDTSAATDIKVTVAGMNYIEHDMQKVSADE